MNSMFRRWMNSTTPIDVGLRSCFGKSAYRTEEIAEKYKAKAEEARGITLRVYSCKICKQFHLTKKPLETQ